MTENISARAEGVGLKKCLDSLLKEMNSNGQYPIARLSTDRSTMISAIMEKSYPKIVHMYDTWHFIRNHLKVLMEVILGILRTSNGG